MTTDAWGVTDGYEDALQTWRPTSERTRAAIHTAMNVDPAAASGGGATASRSPVLVLRPGQVRALPRPAELTLEDGTRLCVERTLPPDLPLGYHTVRAADAADVIQLIVSPGRCHLPEDFAAWGWAVQLYATRSARSWGIGDLGDLARLGSWAAALGAGLLLVNQPGVI